MTRSNGTYFIEIREPNAVVISSHFDISGIAKSAQYFYDLFMFKPADNISLFFFCILLVFIVGVFLLGVYRLGKSREDSFRIMRKNLYWMVGWYLILGLIVFSGLVEKSPFPNLPVFFLTINLVAIGFAFSSEGKSLPEYCRFTDWSYSKALDYP